jgi:hypothetical protein
MSAVRWRELQAEPLGRRGLRSSARVGSGAYVRMTHEHWSVSQSVYLVV